MPLAAWSCASGHIVVRHRAKYRVPKATARGEVWNYWYNTEGSQNVAHRREKRWATDFIWTSFEPAFARKIENKLSVSSRLLAALNFVRACFRLEDWKQAFRFLSLTRSLDLRSSLLSFGKLKTSFPSFSRLLAAFRQERIIFPSSADLFSVENGLFVHRQRIYFPSARIFCPSATDFIWTSFEPASARKLKTSFPYSLAYSQPVVGNVFSVPQAMPFCRYR